MGIPKQPLRKFLLSEMGIRHHNKYFHTNQEFPRGAGSKPSDSTLFKTLVTFRILNSTELPKGSSGSFTPKEWKFLRSPST